MSHARTLLSAPLELVFLTTPAVSEFRVDSDDPNTAVFSQRANFKLHGRRLDPWQVREDLFSIRTTNQLWLFLERTGLFATSIHEFTGLQEWKDLFKLLMVTSPANWPGLKGDFAQQKLSLVLRSQLPRFKIQWGKDTHKVVLAAPSTLTAILASIQVDHLRGVKYAFCQREDCGKPYPLRSNKKFCDYECAHLHTVRRLRAAERKTRKNTRKP
jgi:hypothetical protein